MQASALALKRIAPLTVFLASIFAMNALGSGSVSHADAQALLIAGLTGFLANLGLNAAFELGSWTRSWAWTGVAACPVIVGLMWILSFAPQPPLFMAAFMAGAWAAYLWVVD